ncbi:hypothetical protein LCGC14_2675920 [marine sediment metagenome]|uniref:PEP-CTERM protein-sorting domain-containing protein n=1 Tax=marine sediment metagenome TaxID=412755 RepID=A0A0F9BXP5_9ZZZZ
MKLLSLGLFAAMVVLWTAGTAFGQAVIVGVSIPEDSTDYQGTHASIDDVWSVTAPPFPLDINTGIGFILNPAPATFFSLHDNAFKDSYKPDPTRAVVTYEFDQPVIVDQIELLQHVNGVSRIEGFVGDSLDALISIGWVFGPYGPAAAPDMFQEREPYVFDFDNLQQGTFFRFVILQTLAPNGYAAYQAFPRSAGRVRFALAPELVIQPGDANSDYKVNVFDLAILGNNYNQGGGKDWGDGDFDGDLDVDVYDLALLANHYGYDNGAGEPIPEPGMLCLMAMGVVCLRQRLRRSR